MMMIIIIIIIITMMMMMMITTIYNMNIVDITTITIYHTLVVGLRDGL